jgi:hypothetical protein
MRAVRIKVRKGTLGVHFKNKMAGRRLTERKLAHRIGEKRVVGKLRAIQVFNKNRNPALAAKARADAKYIAGSFKGKMPVKYPQGLSQRKYKEIVGRNRDGTKNYLYVLRRSR